MTRVRATALGVAAAAGFLLAAGAAPAEETSGGYQEVQGGVAVTWTPDGGGGAASPSAPAAPGWDDRVRLEQARVNDRAWEVAIATGNAERLKEGLVEPTLAEVAAQQQTLAQVQSEMASLRASQDDTRSRMQAAGPATAAGGVVPFAVAAGLGLLGLAGAVAWVAVRKAA